ncbi:MAG: YafY family protein [Acidobacteriota bacterium]
MRRADRLFRLVELLRRGSVTTARRLADELEVSARTVYRDIRDLISSGVPIEGEAGVGYRLRGYDLPPLMFSREELDALVLGARIVETWTDPKLARAARAALAKVESALPEGSGGMVRETRLFAPPDHYRLQVEVDLSELRLAIRERRKIRFAYTDAHGADSQRAVRPLGLAFYGPVWILAAWCEMRRDYRAFRPDRMRGMALLEERFEPDDGPSLDGFLGCMAARPEERR